MKILFRILLPLCMLAACSDQTASDAPAEASDSKSEDTMAEVRLVSTSPSATEILYGIGAGTDVVAVDAFSDFPAEAPSESWLDAFSVDVERVIDLDPTSVVLGVSDPDVEEALASVGINVVALPTPTSIEEVIAQYETLGELSMRQTEAGQLTDELLGAIEEARGLITQPRSVYHEVVAGESNQGYYTSYSETFVGDLYQQLGLENIAGASDLSNGLIDPETIISRNPEVIIVNSPVESDDLVAYLSERPGWSDIEAVASERVFVADSSLAGRWGPRFIEYVEQVGEELSE